MTHPQLVTKTLCNHFQEHTTDLLNDMKQHNKKKSGTNLELDKNNSQCHFIALTTSIPAKARRFLTRSNSVLATKAMSYKKRRHTDD